MTQLGVTGGLGCLHFRHAGTTKAKPLMALPIASDDDEGGDVEHGYFLDGVVMFVPVTSDSATHWKTDYTTAVNVDFQAASAR